MAAPTRPNSLVYPLSFLRLYPRLTRAELFAATGKDAPPFQVDRPIKRFVVPLLELGSGDSFTYPYVDLISGKVATNTISKALAGELNLPGVVHYPKYVVAPTVAIANVPVNSGIVPQTVKPEYICLEAEAIRVAAELGADPPVEHFPSTAEFVWGNEKRRPWQITLTGGGVINAGLTLIERHRHGVWAPGHWANPDKAPIWVPAVQTTVVEVNLLPEVPIPIRPLMADEVIARMFMGPTEDNGLVVQRKSLSTTIDDKDKVYERVREIHERVVGPPLALDDMFKKG